MNTPVQNSERFLATIGGLLIVVALLLVACGGSSVSSGPPVAISSVPPAPTLPATPSPAPVTIPAAVPAAFTPGKIYQCNLADAFASRFTANDQDFQVRVGLGPPNCPAGASSRGRLGSRRCSRLSPR